MLIALIPRMLPAILLFIFISNPLLAHSDELARDACSPIRLDDEGGAMEHVEVRNQQQIGSCYAHTAAQMYDSWRFTHGDEYYERQSSGFEIGQRFKIREKRNVFLLELLTDLHLNFLSKYLPEEDRSIDGGILEDVMPLLLEQGSCSQSELDGMFNNISVDQYASGVMRIFKKYQKKYYEMVAKERFRKTHEISKNREIDPFMVSDHTAVRKMRSKEMNESYLKDGIFRREVLDEGVKDLIANNNKVLRVKDLGIHYEDLRADDDTVNMFDVISIINCADARKIKVNAQFKIKNYSTNFNSNLAIRYINRELDLGLKSAYPIGISYCSKLLGKGFDYKTPQDGAVNCGNHASLVVGRRRNSITNRCEYLIRNSWGKSCYGYSKDWTCEKERGTVWVDSEKLSENIYDLQMIH